MTMYFTQFCTAIPMPKEAADHATDLNNCIDRIAGELPENDLLNLRNSGSIPKSVSDVINNEYDDETLRTAARIIVDNTDEITPPEDLSETAVFEVDAKTNTLYVSSWEDGNSVPGTTVNILQNTAQKFDLKEPMVIEYAHYASRPVVDGSGGGAVIITKDKLYHIDTAQCVVETLENIKEENTVWCTKCGEGINLQDELDINQRFGADNEYCYCPSGAFHSWYKTTDEHMIELEPKKDQQCREVDETCVKTGSEEDYAKLANSLSCIIGKCDGILEGISKEPKPDLLIHVDKNGSSTVYSNNPDKFGTILVAVDNPTELNQIGVLGIHNSADITRINSDAWEWLKILKDGDVDDVIRQCLKVSKE